MPANDKRAGARRIPPASPSSFPSSGLPLILACLGLLAGAHGADLQLKDGRVLKDCQIVAVDDATVILKHAGVIEGVPREQVPPAALVQFRLDQEKPQAALEKKKAKPAAPADAVVLVEGTLLETRSDGLRIVQAELPPEVLRPAPTGSEELRRWRAMMDKFSAEKTMRIKGRVALRGSATVQERWISASAVRQGEIKIGNESLPLYVTK